MKTLQFNDRNVSVTMTYDDLQRMMKEIVVTTMREVTNEKKKMEDQKWFDSTQTAKMFGVHVSTICRWKHSGYLTARTIGGRDFFSREEITHLFTLRQNGTQL
jgi:hypothetical protein